MECSDYKGHCLNASIADITHSVNFPAPPPVADPRALRPAGGGAATSLVETAQLVAFSVDSARLAWIAEGATGYAWALRVQSR